MTTPSTPPLPTPSPSPTSWDHDHAEREAIYDAMVEEYEIDARIDAVNQQLDYAQVRGGEAAQDTDRGGRVGQRRMQRGCGSSADSSLDSSSHPHP